MQYVKSAKEMAEFLRKANVTDRENFEHEYTLPIIEKASKGTDEERKWANSILNSHYFRVSVDIMQLVHKCVQRVIHTFCS